jgi:hypothetical protein
VYTEIAKEFKLKSLLPKGKIESAILMIYNRLKKKKKKNPYVIFVTKK